MSKWHSKFETQKRMKTKTLTYTINVPIQNTHNIIGKALKWCVWYILVLSFVRFQKVKLCGEQCVQFTPHIKPRDDTRRTGTRWCYSYVKKITIFARKQAHLCRISSDNLGLFLFSGECKAPNTRALTHPSARIPLVFTLLSEIYSHRIHISHELKYIRQYTHMHRHTHIVCICKYIFHQCVIRIRNFSTLLHCLAYSLERLENI